METIVIVGIIVAIIFLVLIIGSCIIVGENYNSSNENSCNIPKRTCNKPKPKPTCKPKPKPKCNPKIPECKPKPKPKPKIQDCKPKKELQKCPNPKPPKSKQKCPSPKPPKQKCKKAEESRKPKMPCLYTLPEGCSS